MGGSNSDDDCDAGSESCPCRTDGSCDSGLMCASNTCVFVPGTGATAGTSSNGGTTSEPTGGSSTGGTRSAGVPGGKPKPQTTGGTDGSGGAGDGGAPSTIPECPVCEGDTPVCDAVAGICRTCTAAQGCSGDTVCDEKANGDLGACVPLVSGGGGAGGEGSTGGVPPEWICPPTYYGDTDCDCGCGAVDVDCPDANASSCDFCVGCNHTGIISPNCPGAIVPDDNSRCEGWTCEPDWYEDMDCDCGCGVIDPACADSSVGSCDFCLGCNNHPQLMCPGSIDVNDNTTCTP